MNRLFLLGLVAVFALIACSSGGNEDTTKEAAANHEVGENATNVNDEATNETENDDTDADESEVEILVPADFFGDQPEEEVIASFKEDGIDNVLVNDDGSFTLTMTKDQQTAYLSEMKADMQADMDELVTAMELDFIRDMKMNEDATALIAEIDKAQYDGDMGGIVLMDFALYAAPYQLMNGVTEEEFDFEVVLVDSETGEEMERTSIHDE